MNVFLEQHMIPGVPVILTNCMESWPAIRRWSDLSYLKRVAGRRTVPVEVGEDNYLGEKWGQQLMTMAVFIEDYLQRGENQKGCTGYLAQHDLLQQIPALRRDILVPDFCALETSSSDLDGGDVIANAWLGPAGTVSPAHTDPYHNLLCQVVGSKYIKIFPPSETPRMYPHEGMMKNSSQVSVQVL